MVPPVDHVAAPPRPAACRQWPGDVVRVLERDPDLLDGLDPEAAAAASARALARTFQLGTGRWTPPGPAEGAGTIGLLLLDGLMTHSVGLNGVRCPELLGQGDIIRPWDTHPAFTHAEEAATWRVLKPATIAVLGPHVHETIRRWPIVATSLLTRSLDRSRWLSRQLAVPHVRRADDRLRLLMGDLAARWGRVAPHGIVLPLPLTNQLLADLTCLRRPSVSSAMTRLAETGEIVRRPGAGFVLNLNDDDGARVGRELDLEIAA